MILLAAGNTTINLTANHATRNTPTFDGAWLKFPLNVALFPCPSWTMEVVFLLDSGQIKDQGLTELISFTSRKAENATHDARCQFHPTTQRTSRSLPFSTSFSPFTCIYFTSFLPPPQFSHSPPPPLLGFFSCHHVIRVGCGFGSRAERRSMDS